MVLLTVFIVFNYLHAFTKAKRIKVKCVFKTGAHYGAIMVQIAPPTSKPFVDRSVTNHWDYRQISMRLTVAWWRQFICGRRSTHVQTWPLFKKTKIPLLAMKFLGPLSRKLYFTKRQIKYVFWSNFADTSFRDFVSGGFYSFWLFHFRLSKKLSPRSSADPWSVTGRYPAPRSWLFGEIIFGKLKLWSM